MSLAMAMPSSSSSKGIIVMTGPKISSRATRIVVVACDQGRGDVVPYGQVGRSLAADHDLATVLSAVCDVRLDPSALRRRDHRPDDRRGVGRVAHLEEAGHLHQAIAHLVEDAAVHDGPGRGGADLPGVERPG